MEPKMARKRRPEKIIREDKYREYWQKTMIPEISCNHLRQLHPRTQRPNGRATMARRTSAHLSIHPHQELHLYRPSSLLTIKSLVAVQQTSIQPYPTSLLASSEAVHSFQFDNMPVQLPIQTDKFIVETNYICANC